jgi:hypothetical protein
VKPVLSRLAVLVCLALAIVLGCKTTKHAEVRKPAPVAREAPTTPPPQVTRVDYVDSDAFDLLLETALLNAQPVIVVQTDHDKPEWGPRLNEWIAAWNASRRAPGPRARGQIPTVPNVVVDADSIREFRLLIDGLMSRVEESARVGGQWWTVKHTRDRRVALLRPYGLRFHLDADDHIQLIFFHGDYAAHHKDVVRALADPAGEDSLEWSPDYCCSRARGPKKAAGTR